MYGWRVRLGVMVPCVNSVVEPEFSLLAPRGVASYCTRMQMRGGTKEEQLASMAAELESYVDSLRDVADLFVYACTSGSFLKGPDWDQEIVRRLTELSGKQAVTTSGALVKALQTLGVNRVALATPYTESINAKQIDYLHHFGIRVVAARGLAITARGGAGLSEPAAAYRLAKEVAALAAVEALLISCTNFRTLEVIDPLEEDLGLPVVTANQATFWAALRLAGLKDKIYGYGRLLAEF